MTRIVEVVEYDQQWPMQFALESEKIKQALGDNCVAVHHIGSTSIPGLAAKPIIDILPVVKDILKIDNEALESLGYVARGELGMPFRRFFNKGHEQRTHHLHVWEQGNPEIEKHLLFRDYLIHNVDAKKQYADLKYNLAQNFKHERAQYTASKDDFIKDIIVKSGFNGLTIVQALLDHEWEGYHRIRKEQIFDHIPGIIYDPKHPTIFDKNNYHFVLMKGVKVVAIAQIEMLDEDVAALRSLATDQDFKNQGIGTYLLAKMERWVSHQCKVKILLHANLNAESFYRKRGYVDMEFKDISINPKNVDLGKLL